MKVIVLVRHLRQALFLFLDEGTDAKHAFLNESFLDKLIGDINYLLRTPKCDASSTKYKDVVRRLRACTKQATSLVIPLLEPVTECLTSSFYSKVFENIELTRTKAVSGALAIQRTLAPKHIFFMRECPEFYIQHSNYEKTNTKDRDEENCSEKGNEKDGIQLIRKMLESTDTIFQIYLPILIRYNSKSPRDIIRKYAVWFLQ